MSSKDKLIVVKVFLALLALTLIFPLGLSCRTAEANAAIEASCCGPNCPIPSSAGERNCCEQSALGSLNAEQVSSKPDVPSPEFSLILSLPRLAVFSSTQFLATKLVEDSPPQAAKLALLCSRQI